MNDADPRVKRTRKLLEEAFIALLAEKRFRSISVQDIAERATLNRATFYAHFEDKYALMDHLIGARFLATLQRRVPSGAPLTEGNLCQVVLAVCEFLQEFIGGCNSHRPMIEESDLRLGAKVQQELRAYLLGWISRAPPTLDVPPETIASLASWAIFGAGTEWGLSESTLSIDDWARQVVAALGVGVLRHVDMLDAPGRLDAPAGGASSVVVATGRAEPPGTGGSPGAVRGRPRG